MSSSATILEHLGRLDLCVSAGAGAGKTRLLIDAYFAALDIVEGEVGEPYERVVAITFTNEAATEIRRRVIKRLLSREDRVDPDRILQANTIGTIHSFCQGLLRELGHLVGVNPLFEIPDEVDLADLQRAVADMVATEMLDSSDTAGAGQRLFGLYPFESWQFVPGLVSWVHQAYTRARWQLHDADSARAAIVSSWRSIVAPTLIEDARERRRRVSAELGVAENLADFVCQFVGNHLPVVTAFAEFVRRYWVRLDQEKAAAGWLSQDDTLYYTARLLGVQDICEMLRERYRFLLVDEYQDTDPLQHRVVQALRRSGATFRVGDLKQSIYRFRSARPSIFMTLAKEAAQNDGLKSLDTNRRAVPELRDFWNEVFPHIFTSGSGLVRYEPLTGGPDFYATLPRDAPPVEVFRLPREADGMPVDARRVEAAWIARRIRELVGRFDVYDVQEARWRKAGFRDVALLFRVKTHIEKYLEALVELGIPYVFLGGKDFFARPEVQTVVTALHWIAHPTSPFHTAAVLRSALVGVADRTLLAVARHRFQLTPAICDEVAGRDEVEAGKLRGFLSLRERLLALREGPAARVVEELLRATGFAEAVLAQPEGTQKYGNVRRLVGLIREYDAEPGGSLASLAAKFQRAVDEEREETEALVADQGSDAVRIMTVHGAKGLEFSVVFVPEGFRRQRPIGRDFLVDAHEDRELEFFLAPRIPEDLPEAKQKTLREVTSRLAARVFDREVREVDAEERRLLYVSFTRARELLAFSLPAPVEERGRPPEIPPWSQLLEAILGPAITAEVEQARVPGGTARFRVVRDVAVVSPQPLLRDRLSEYPEQPVHLLRPPGLARIVPAISAGAVAEYRYCPYRYYLGRELGIPGGPTVRSLEETGSEADKGTLAHLALQQCDLATGKIPEAILTRAGDDRPWLEELVRSFLDSCEGREVRELPQERVLREARFRFLLPGAAGTAVVGVIDMAYEGEEGWKVVEYKTGEPRRETRDLHMDQTRVYATGLRHGRGLDVRAAVVAYLTQPEKAWTRFTPRPADLSLDEISTIASACSRGEFPARPARDLCGACPYGGRGGICPERYRPAKEEA